jgi:hypothetical protein
MTDTIIVQEVAEIRQRLQRIGGGIAPGLESGGTYDPGPEQSPCEPVKTCIQKSQKRHRSVTPGARRRFKVHENLTKPNIEGDRKCLPGQKTGMTRAKPVRTPKNSRLKGHGYEIHTPGIDSAGNLSGQDQGRDTM